MLPSSLFASLANCQYSSLVFWGEGLKRHYNFEGVYFDTNLFLTKAATSRCLRLGNDTVLCHCAVTITSYTTIRAES